MFIGALANSAFAQTLNSVTTPTPTIKIPFNQWAPRSSHPGWQRRRPQPGRIFVRLDLSPLPTGATVLQAFLRVLVNRVVNNSGPSGTINIFELNGTWTADERKAANNA